MVVLVRAGEQARDERELVRGAERVAYRYQDSTNKSVCNHRGRSIQSRLLTYSRCVNPPPSAGP